MMKLPFALLVASVATLAGCDLYFGDGHGHGDSNWNYCGSDGYYTCSGDNCEWQGPTCPPGVGGSGSPQGGTSGSGYECNANSDCAAGCYCAGGTCTEAGFCTQDSDCGNGYVCNTDRSSCEPGTPIPPKTTCDYDSQCPSGSYCAADHTCTATCTCANDQEAVNGGFGWCDESRNTCLPGQDPAGTCAGEATASCSVGRPACPAGQVATLIDGCYTGQCRALASCDLAPECTHLTDQNSCDGRQDCKEVVNGINCVNDLGQACQAGQSNCSCDSYVYASCAAK